MPRHDPLRTLIDTDLDDGFDLAPTHELRSPRVERPRGDAMRSPSKQDRIAILAQQGMRDADIARTLGCSRAYVRVARQRAGLFEPRKRVLPLGRVAPTGRVTS